MAGGAAHYLRWPGELPRGRVSAQVAMTMDVTASILAARGARGPARPRPDGIDLLPILRGAAPLRDRSLFWRWDPPNRRQRAVRSGRWKLLDDSGQLLLFDLVADPGERTDLAARHPEVAATLKRLLAAWQADVDSTARGR